MWIEAIVIGIIVGLLRGGRVSHLSNLNLRQINIFVLGVIVQLLPMFLGSFGFVREKATLIYFAGYLLVFVFLLFNFSKRGFKFLLAGAALNLLTLLIHGFKMPVYVNSIQTKIVKMKLAIKTGELVNYLPLEELDSFSDYLGKIIPMPDFYLGIPVISIADLIITLGIILVIQASMVSKRGFFV